MVTTSMKKMLTITWVMLVQLSINLEPFIISATPTVTVEFTTAVTSKPPTETMAMIRPMAMADLLLLRPHGVAPMEAVEFSRLLLIAPPAAVQAPLGE